MTPLSLPLADAAAAVPAAAPASFENPAGFAQLLAAVSGDPAAPGHATATQQESTTLPTAADASLPSDQAGGSGETPVGPGAVIVTDPGGQLPGSETDLHEVPNASVEKIAQSSLPLRVRTPGIRTLVEREPDPVEKGGEADETGASGTDVASLALQQALASVTALVARTAPGSNGLSTRRAVEIEARGLPLALRGNPGAAARSTAPTYPSGPAIEDLSGPGADQPVSPDPKVFTVLPAQDAPASSLLHARPASTAATVPASSDEASAPTEIDLNQLDSLVRDIVEISGSRGRASFRLAPDRLGPLEVSLHASDAGVSVSIRTNTEQGQSAVVQAQQQLSDDMRANGLKVAATSVMLGQGGDHRQHHRQSLPLPSAIETATSEAREPDSPDYHRPDGRYA